MREERPWRSSPRLCALATTRSPRWAADTGFSGGSTSSTAATVAGTADQPLYQSNRYGGTFSYRFGNLPNGTYQVTLKFAETYWTQAGKRVFNVALNGQQVLSNFDILAQVAPKTALDKTFTTTVSSGTLTISFTTVKDAAKVAAIQIVAGGAAFAPTVTASSSASGLTGGSQVEVGGYYRQYAELVLQGHREGDSL